MIEASMLSEETPAQSNTIRKAELLPEHRADPNIRMSGKTPLHIACQKGFKEYAILLLDHGANMNLQDHEGDTPLHIVKKFGWT